MTHDTTRDCDGTASGLARSGARGSVRLPQTEILAKRPHDVDAGPSRRIKAVILPALDARFWSQRKWELERMLPLWPWQVDDTSIAGVAAMVKTLSHAARREGSRIRSGHWAGETARHANILHRLSIERALLKQLRKEAST